MYGLSYYDLEFEKIPIQRVSSCGTPYFKWLDVGMPTIPAQFLNCIFYLYKNMEDAEAGQNTGGTGFLIALHSPDQKGHHYGVTNWHVAVRDGFSVIRINKHLGGFEIFELGPEDWEYEPKKDDIAIAPISLHDSPAVANFIGPELLKYPDVLTNLKIGPGDDVFMIGRFIDLDVKQTNVPALRFGNISTLPVPIKQPTGYEDGLSYCIDMHSRSGYSGSPVFVYRTPGNNLEWVLGQPFDAGVGLLLLLGIHWGQFGEPFAVKKKKRVHAQSRKSTEQFDEYIEGMSGMTCVIPSWRIMDLLKCEKFVKQRRRENILRAAKATPTKSAPIAESSREVKKRKKDEINPHAKEDFNRLLDKAVRGKASSL